VQKNPGVSEKIREYTKRVYELSDEGRKASNARRIDNEQEGLTMLPMSALAALNEVR
jgi:hypothetical protein